jgi:hypothetical protein
MKKLLRYLVTATTEQDTIYNYLCDSVSLSDLERRQRLIERGQAPWQLQSKMSLRGWA